MHVAKKTCFAITLFAMLGYRILLSQNRAVVSRGCNQEKNIEAAENTF